MSEVAECLKKIPQKKFQSEEILRPTRRRDSGGQEPVKTFLPQQVWIYAEALLGWRDEQLLLSDLPASGQHWTFRSQGFSRLSPASPHPPRPNCQPCGVPGEVWECWQGGVWGSHLMGKIWEWKELWRKEGARTPWLTETGTFYSALKTLYPQCLSVLGMPASIAFPGKGCHFAWCEPSTQWPEI